MVRQLIQFPPVTKVYTFLLLLGIILNWNCNASKEEAKKQSYNVLFIAVDDLNDWVGCLGGHPQAITPNLDRLAERGMLFTQAYCAAPACNPSRAALMTGIRPSTSGVYLNSQPWRESPVLKEAVTIPQHFSAHGYRAAGSGKIFHDRFRDPQSWNDYWPALDRQRPDDPMPAGRPLNGISRTAHFDWGPLSDTASVMGDEQVTNWVSRQLAQPHDKPFFLACGIYRPHLPWYVPPKYFEPFSLEEIQLPRVLENDLADLPAGGVKMARQRDHENVTKYGQWKPAVQGYLASIHFADDMLGKVIDALDQSEYADSTIIVLWADHGWSLGQKEHWRKFALWENTNHVPLIVIAPGVTKAGQRCNTPVNLLDIYPTLNELCGLPSRPELEGQSLVPLLKDPAAAWDRPSLSTHGRNNHSLRDARWRYIRYEDGGEELYDHENDPLEWTNLADDPQYVTVKQGFQKWLPEKNVEAVKEVNE